MHVPDPLLRQLLDSWPVAHLTSITPAGRPHVVPIVYCRDGDSLYSPIDGKTKRGGPLQREANINANPTVALLLDHYDRDWELLWWVRLDGEATLCQPARDHAAMLRSSLLDRYQQYRKPGLLPAEPIYLRITWRQVSGWAQQDLHATLQRAALSGVTR